MKKQFSGNAMTAPLMAVALLAVLSIIDWSEVTGGRMSNFSLIEDLLDVDEVANELHTTAEILDPALDAALSEVTSEAELPVQELSVDELPLRCHRLAISQPVMLSRPSVRLPWRELTESGRSKTIRLTVTASDI
jgi:hypothetical protein